MVPLYPQDALLGSLLVVPVGADGRVPGGGVELGQEARSLHPPEPESDPDPGQGRRAVHGGGNGHDRGRGAGGEGVPVAGPGPGTGDPGHAGHHGAEATLRGRGRRRRGRVSAGGRPAVGRVSPRYGVGKSRQHRGSVPLSGDA